MSIISRFRQIMFGADGRVSPSNANDINDQFRDLARDVSSIDSSLGVRIPGAGLINGKITTFVATNNLTVAIKGLNGEDPSATNPVSVVINGTIRSITSALSVTKNAGTNWCNAGSAELATKEIDYFVYVGYNTIDGVVVGFSRIPFGRVYSDFSTTPTNEKYCAISTITNAANTDDYELVGRFNAILSAGVGYTWSIPATSIIINRPITQTRWLDYNPQFTAIGGMTFSVTTVDAYKYRLDTYINCLSFRTIGTTSGTASNEIRFSVPFNCLNYDPLPGQLSDVTNPSVTSMAFTRQDVPNTVSYRKYNGANYLLGNPVTIACGGNYRIA